MPPTSRTPDRPERRHDLDWLRVFATYMLFVFHVAMVFNPAPFYHIRNHEVALVMLILCGFISLWHMPLFFLLAGWSAFSSLRARGRRSFLNERFLKLLIPLLIGCALYGPAIKYLELSSGMDANYSGLYVSEALAPSFHSVIPSGLPTAPVFEESFLEFLPSFYTRLERFTWSHLWFIAYLFTFTLLYAPLFFRLARTRARLTRPRALWVYLPIVPLALIQLTLRERYPGLQNLYSDWANFGYYSVYLVVGFLLAREPELERVLHGERRRALGLALAATSLLLLAVLGVLHSTPLVLAGSAAAGWCWVVALLGFVHARVRESSPRRRYLVESAYPVYILHQPSIVLIGYALIQLPASGAAGIAIKFGALLLLSVAAVLAVYHFAIRRSPILRFAHGMKPGAATRPAEPGYPARSPAAVGRRS
jgi:peptidoglycan/LPS O-acetylase OafA/YrhL